MQIGTFPHSLTQAGPIRETGPPGLQYGPPFLKPFAKHEPGGISYAEVGKPETELDQLN